MNKTRVRLAREEGQLEGRQEGQLSAFRAAITELLEARFGSVPSEMREWVVGIADAELLRRILRVAGTTDSLDAFRTSVGR